MQTFLPHPNFACSAMVLDARRLGKQRLEARQIVSAIRHGGGWRRHPIVIMWRDHVPALQLYGDVMIREWVRRGYVNTMEEVRPDPSTIVMPPWLGREDIHASHRSALLFKDPASYRPLGWTDEARIAYVWAA